MRFAGQLIRPHPENVPEPSWRAPPGGPFIAAEAIGLVREAGGHAVPAHVGGHAGAPLPGVGGGKVAARKVADLLAAGARVTVVAPDLEPGLQGRVDCRECAWHPRSVETADLEDVMLVCICTHGHGMNASIAAAARQRGQLVNVAAPSEAGNVVFPAVQRVGPLTLAVGTGGLSPTMGQRIRDELAAHMAAGQDSLVRGPPGGPGHFSAFGTAEVIQHLLELGYDLVVKRYTIDAFRHLWDSAPADAWVQIGKKRHASEALPLPPVPLAIFYPLRQVALRRWDAKGKDVRSLVVTTLAAAEVPFRDVVACYEARPSRRGSKSGRAPSTSAIADCGSSRPTPHSCSW